MAANGFGRIIFGRCFVIFVPLVVSKNLQLIAAHPIILQPIILQKNEAHPIFLPLNFSTTDFIFTPPFLPQEILFASIRAIRS